MAGSSNKTHQRALAATDISNDTEENHASQLGISYQLVGQELVGTQHKYVETPTFYTISEKKGLIKVDRGLIPHDNLYVQACETFFRPPNRATLEKVVASWSGCEHKNREFTVDSGASLT